MFEVIVKQRNYGIAFFDESVSLCNVPTEKLNSAERYCGLRWDSPSRQGKQELVDNYIPKLRGQEGQRSEGDRRESVQRGRPRFPNS